MRLELDAKRKSFPHPTEELSAETTEAPEPKLEGFVAAYSDRPQSLSSSVLFSMRLRSPSLTMACLVNPLRMAMLARHLLIRRKATTSY